MNDQQIAALFGSAPSDAPLPKVPIEVLSGEVNLRGGSAKSYVFHAPRAGSFGVEERILPVAAKSGPTAPVISAIGGFAQRLPSVQGYNIEVGGSMTKQAFAVAEGEILKIFVNRRPGAGKLAISACQFVRVRETAALRCIEAKLLSDPTVNHPFAFMRGRFDLLTLEEAMALGVKVGDGFKRFFHPATAEHAFTISILQKELSKAEVKVNPDGEASVVETVVRRRSIGGF